MLCACVDIGSNTTRVLVADVGEGALAGLLEERSFTRIGADLRATGELSAGKIDEVARVVAEQCDAARRAGASAIRVVATAAIRAARNRDALVAAVEARAGRPLDVLTGEEEARLAFVGATRTLPEAPEGTVGVVDVGGGSTEVAVGTLGAGVAWARSFRIGSGLLADAYQRGDPVTAAELARMRRHAGEVLSGLDVPRPETAVAVGGSATSLRRLIGPVLDSGTVSRALDVLLSAPCEHVARDAGLDPERVRLLPAGLVVLWASTDLLGCPLQIGRGGIREGVCLELAA